MLEYVNSIKSIMDFSLKNHLLIRHRGRKAKGKWMILRKTKHVHNETKRLSMEGMHPTGLVSCRIY